MLRHDNGYQFLDREFRSCGPVHGGFWPRVDVLCQDISDPGAHPPERSRGRPRADAREDRDGLLVEKVKQLLGLDLRADVEDLQARTSALEETLDQMIEGFKK